MVWRNLDPLGSVTRRVAENAECPVLRGALTRFNIVSTTSFRNEFLSGATLKNHVPRS